MASKTDERHTMSLSRYDLSPQQFYLKEGDEVYITHKGEHYFLVVDSVIPNEGGPNEITISGTLKPL